MKVFVNKTHFNNVHINKTLSILYHSYDFFLKILYDARPPKVEDKAFAPLPPQILKETENGLFYTPFDILTPSVISRILLLITILSL